MTTSPTSSAKAAKTKRKPDFLGAIAQLGERLNGIQEVGGSIPPGSTKLKAARRGGFFFWACSA